MTAEKLHDAIGMLPSDLIAEADKKRCRKPKVIHWRRYAAMAACFALVACAAWFASVALIPRGATESAAEFAADSAPAAAAPMEQAAQEEAAPAESVENGMSGSGTITEDTTAAETRTAIPCERYSTPDHRDSSVNSSSAPDTVLIRTRGELEDYLEDYSWRYDFSMLSVGISAYDDAWFANHDLLILVVHAAHTDFPYTVTEIEDARGKDPKGWDWYVFFTSAGEGYPGKDFTNFHLLTELEKDLISPADSILTVADVSEEPGS